jgi:aspartate racemase
MSTRRPIIGILGGMGPEATIDLMRRVLMATPAADDCDHVHLLVDSNPDVPSRIAALIDRTGQSPGPELVDMARRLEAAGAEALAIACNTAHAYAPDITRAVSIPLLDMIALTADRIAAMALRHRRVGLLASTAVVNLGLYEKALGERRISIAVPHRQADLVDVIRAVKRGDSGTLTRQMFARVADELIGDDVDLLLIACTELSLLGDSINPEAPCQDALDVLVSEIVRFGLGQREDTGAPAQRISQR